MSDETCSPENAERVATKHELQSLRTQLTQAAEREAKLVEALEKVPLLRMTKDALGWECVGCGAVSGITASGKDRDENCKPGCHVFIVDQALADYRKGKEGR